ncbi:MAG: CDP-alcohol phosphatidyltransferase [candidate division KSB1 bacterium]|nr:CDP-alcohol phosphatidyltransferase [candidate division KSB1 bacterium]
MFEKVFSDRERTNFLKYYESSLILYLCERMPAWITPNRLTAIGVLGSLLVFAGFWMGHYLRIALLISIIGLAVNWFGDSLDGRLAYYRNIPRKWYGFCLDIVVDWLSMFLVVMGFYVYFDTYRWLPFVFLLAYGGLMLIALLRYKITDSYSIDAFQLGPTEMRIIIAVLILIEMIRRGTLLQASMLGAVIILFFTIMALRSLLQAADLKDQQEKDALAAEQTSDVSE